MLEYDNQADMYNAIKHTKMANVGLFFSRSSNFDVMKPFQDNHCGEMEKNVDNLTWKGKSQFWAYFQNSQNSQL